MKRLFSILIVLFLVGGLLFLSLEYKNQRSGKDENMNAATTGLTTGDKITDSNSPAHNIIMKIESSAFKSGSEIPSKYTCDGSNVLPPFSFSNVPENTSSLALVIDDPDAPGGTWTHLLAWNIDPKTTELNENDSLDNAVLGSNDFGNSSYGGPCPPSGTHHYYFKLFALSKNLNIPSGSSRKDLEEVMKGNIVTQSQLIGIYSRK